MYILLRKLIPTDIYIVIYCKVPYPYTGRSRYRTYCICILSFRLFYFEMGKNNHPNTFSYF